MTAALWTSMSQALSRMALPLAAYYTVTLAVPLANGAARSGATFIEHALVVLVVPPTIILLVCGLNTIVRAVISGCVRRGRSPASMEDRRVSRSDRCE